MTSLTKNVPALRFPEFAAAPPWETKTLGEVCEIIGGGTPSTEDDSYWGGDIPWISPVEMGKSIDPYVSITRKTITESGLKKSSGKLIPPNSVILSIRAPIGHLAINNVPMATDRGCFGIVPSGYINHKFLFYYLFICKKELNLLGAGSTFTVLTIKTVKSFLIPLPSLPEQEKIAACLSSLDEVMIGQSAKLDSLRDYKKGLLQQLFPLEGETVPRLRFPEFETAPPWETKKLGEVCVTYSGGTPSTKNNEFYGGDIPFIRSGEIEEEKTELFLTKFGLESSSAKLVKKGDVLVALYGANSGEVSISKINGAINQAILCIQSFQSNGFIFNYLFFLKKWIVATYLQGGQGNLSGEIIKAIELKFPSLPEQEKIADCLSSLDDQITAASDQLATLKSHKKGLMQQLFPDLEGFQGSALAGS